MFKKFNEFLLSEKEESKKPKKTSQLAEEMPDPELETPKSVLSDKCPKCGSTKVPCECAVDDYYDSKLPQQAPKPTKKYTK